MRKNRRPKSSSSIVKSKLMMPKANKQTKNQEEAKHTSHLEIWAINTKKNYLEELKVIYLARENGRKEDRGICCLFNRPYRIIGL